MKVIILIQILFKKVAQFNKLRSNLFQFFELFKNTLKNDKMQQNCLQMYHS